jgi:predicted glutamine amidotransferase
MCELLAIIANKQVPITLSWSGFKNRADYNGDGWGLTAHRDDGFKVWKNFKSANKDPVVDEFLKPKFEIRLLLSHVRYAVTSEKSMENTQPFTTSIEDNEWAFVGTMNDYCKVSSRFKETVKDCCQGTTGTEVLFCMVAKEIGNDSVKGIIPAVSDQIQKVIKGISSNAQFSFILSNGAETFAYRFRKPLFYLNRKPPYGPKKVKMLDSDFEICLGKEKDNSEIATILATNKMTDEDWKIFPDRTLCSITYDKVCTILIV